MKLSTINQVVESILKPVGESPKDGELSKPEQRMRIIANEAAIYGKTFWIAENKGIDEAMEYFRGAHNEDEYREFRTSITKGE